MDRLEIKCLNDNESEVRSQKISRIIMVSLIFIGCFSFFYCAHPIYIYDSDDWTYITYSRQAFPDVNQWNPTKVLPETLMPLIAEIGVRFIYPITNDYIQSLSCIFAIVLSGIITIYISVMIKRLREHFDISSIVCLLLGVACLLTHFMPYNVDEIQNRFVFYGGNANCYFNYIIPGLFNAVLVLMYLKEDIDTYKWNKERAVKSGFLLLIIYLCINSNMFHSIIFISFLCSDLLIMFIYSIHEKNQKIYKTFIYVIKERIYDVFVLVAWLISIIIESQGSRAKVASGTTISNLPILKTIKLFVASLKQLNMLWVFMVVIICIAAIITLLLRNKKRDSYDEKYFYNLMKVLLACVITVIYLILLCSKVTPEYIQNSTVMISWMFWIIFLLFYSFTYLLKRWNVLNLFVPIMLYLLVFNTVIDGKTFAENNVVWNYSINTVKDLDEYIIEQIKVADDNGLEYVEVKVPVSESLYWPLDTSYAGDRIANSLYRHGVIKHQIHTTVIQDESVNQMFGIGISTMP